MASSRLVNTHMPFSRLSSEPMRLPMSSKIGSVGKAHRHEHMRADHEFHRRDFGSISLSQPNRRRAEIERAVIVDQAARRLDPAEGLFRGNANAEQPLDELLFLVGRIQEIGPDDLRRHFRADIPPVLGRPSV